MQYKTFTIVIHNPDTMKQLDKLAKKEHRNRSAQIEYIIEKYLREYDDEFNAKNEPRTNQSV